MRSLWMIVGVGASGCVVVDSVEQDDASFEVPVSTVITDLGAGDLVVRVAAVTDPTVLRTLRWTGRRPEVDAWVENGELHLDVDCRPMQWVCDVDHEVLLPATASVDAVLGSGDVIIEGLASPVTVELGSGDVELFGIEGDVAVFAGSGDLEADEITGTFHAETGSGDIVLNGASSSSVFASAGSGDVVFELVTAPIDLRVETGSGDVDLGVPAGSYRIDTETGSGDVAIDGIDTDQGADSVLDISTGSGDVTIVGR